LRAPLVISSIGSVPEIIPGVIMKGEYYVFSGEELPRYNSLENVFGVGNVVTGQGNIRVSLVHSQRVTNQVLQNYLGVGDGDGDISGAYAPAEARANAQASAVEEHVRARPPLTESGAAAIEQRIAELQERAGYKTAYDDWIAKVTPSDLE